MSDDTAPERIGLKLSEGYEHNDYSVVTYHFDEEGVEYVRADLFDALEAERDRLREALEALVSLNDDHGPFGGDLYRDRVDSAWGSARTALKGDTP